MDLCKIFSGARSLGQDAGSGVVDRFIHNLMKYCKVILQKVYAILFLSKTCVQIPFICGMDQVIFFLQA